MKAGVENILALLQRDLYQIKETLYQSLDPSLSWARVMTDQLKPASAGWAEGMGHEEVESEGWVEGVGHQLKDSEGWSEGMDNR